jgi:hypothetical protein
MLVLDWNARLRMQCSSLNHHLFRKNIVNSPFCQCGATETTAHFLLHCPRHNATRLRYIHTINLPINLNTDLLLFGSTDLTNTLNTDIFLNVQKFIISSKRAEILLKVALNSMTLETNTTISILCIYPKEV